MRDSSLSLLRGTIGETVRFFIAFLKFMKSDFSFSLKCNKETYRLIQDLRGGFNLFLQKKICEPSPVDWSSEEGALLRAIIELITIDGKFEDDFDDNDDSSTSSFSRSSLGGESSRYYE